MFAAFIKSISFTVPLTAPLSLSNEPLVNPNFFPSASKPFSKSFTFTSSSKTILNGSKAHHTDGQATTYYKLTAGQVYVGSSGSAVDAEIAAGIVGDLA